MMPKRIKDEFDRAYTGLGMMRQASPEGTLQRGFIDKIFEHLTRATDMLDNEYVIGRREE